MLLVLRTFSFEANPQRNFVHKYRLEEIENFGFDNQNFFYLHSPA
jgi:hypothetical protein